MSIFTDIETENILDTSSIIDDALIQDIEKTWIK